MKKPIVEEAMLEFHGLWWHRIYQMQEHVHFEMATYSTGKPDESPLRMWWGWIYNEKGFMEELHESLKENVTFSEYVSWSFEVLGEWEVMTFYYRDFDAIFDLITEALIEYEA